MGPPRESDRNKKCFIIDLDETLVHSSFKAVEKADFRVGVEIDGCIHQVYVLKRPFVDEFLQAMADIYECVLFTASLSKYADPVADFLDKWNVFRYRLFREACVYHRGNYVKDLAQIGRPIDQIVILDNSPVSYMFHATHAVRVILLYHLTILIIVFVVILVTRYDTGHLILGQLSRGRVRKFGHESTNSKLIIGEGGTLPIRFLIIVLFSRYISAGVLDLICRHTRIICEHIMHPSIFPFLSCLY
ncbi:unnamed protein product [Schistocephalus solidus]|uniref:FCP1 homology domain-containing protein n=1 Tax=Schistocephalus solidus TaxID=70667 RepID=A0A3P7ELQ4_SCHSO|nr:unnamed protein product [Schistocephalus solidus]